MNTNLAFYVAAALAATEAHYGPPPPSIREHQKGGPEVIAKAEAKRKRKADKRKREAAL